MTVDYFSLGIFVLFLFANVYSVSSAEVKYMYSGFTWAGWSQCSATCDYGTRARYGQTVKCQPYQPCKRTFAKQTAKCYGGRSCDGPDVEWGSWGQCSVKCGRGYKVRRGKVDCSDLRRRYPTARCYPSVVYAKTDCTGSQCTYKVTWGSWSKCSASCGGGIRTRYGIMRCSPYWYGCSSRQVKKIEACNKDPCPTDSIPTTKFVPTTVIPTTEEPTTTAVPTTVIPTTLEPTTEEPTTEEPTTEEPTTEEPTTEEPTTEEPTTEEPTTEEPTTEEPTTEEPTTVEPTTTSVPTTVPPTTEEPTTTAVPTTILPTTEEPTTTAPPTTEEPTTTSPPTTPVATTVEPTTTEAPTTEEPTTTAVPTTIPPSPTDECTNDDRITDVCNQLCQCVQGEFVCYRVRKEISSMTQPERERYINAYKQIPVDNRTRDRYFELIDMHQRLFFDGLHDDVYFLPWHRWYLLQIENLVRVIDCRVTVPYWAWSLVANDAFTQPLWSDDDSWFGGDGNPLENQCVQTGPFREGEFEMIDSSPDSCLQRMFSTTALPNQMLVNVVLDIAPEDVTDFLFGLEVTLHNRVHCQISGTMCSVHSANAPEFFLHHGYIDKIWEDWQKKSVLHKTALYEDDVIPMTSRFDSGTHLAAGLAPTHLYDNENLPEDVRIRYEAPNHHRSYVMTAAIDQGLLHADDFRSVPQVPVGDMPEGAWRLFGFANNLERLQAAKEKDAELTALLGDVNPEFKTPDDQDLGFNVEDVVKMAQEKSAAN